MIDIRECASPVRQGDFWASAQDRGHGTRKGSGRVPPKWFLRVELRPGVYKSKFRSSSDNQGRRDYPEIRPWPPHSCSECEYCENDLGREESKVCKCVSGQRSLMMLAKTLSADPSCCTVRMNVCVSQRVPIQNAHIFGNHCKGNVCTNKT